MPTYREWHRSSLRLKGYDYAQAGIYFVTVCSYHRQCLFGEIHNGQMQVNAAGGMVQENWEDLSERFPFVVLDAFVVMPNHLHGIICLIEQDTTTATTPGRGEPCVRPPLLGSAYHEDGPPGDGRSGDGRTQSSPLRASTQEYRHPHGTESGTIGRIVQAFKSITTHQYTQGVKQNGWTPFEGRIWQRNYHEHIIRHEEAMNGIREYIIANPARWAEDADNPNNPLEPA